MVQYNKVWIKILGLPRAVGLELWARLKTIQYVLLSPLIVPQMDI